MRDHDLKRAPHFAPPHQETALGERETAEGVVREALRRRGLKYTRTRAEVLHEVLATHDHFDAQTLHHLIRKRNGRSSKATVYRTLALLKECGVLREVFQGQRGMYYEHVYGRWRHDHMICLGCGKVIEFGSSVIEAIQAAACRDHGFHAVQHQCQVFGYCAECHRKEAGASR